MTRSQICDIPRADLAHGFSVIDVFCQDVTDRCTLAGTALSSTSAVTTRRRRSVVVTKGLEPLAWDGHMPTTSESCPAGSIGPVSNMRGSSRE